jgi:lipopolysaccharide/colanic/teichoic acid biosynthesis glycosyltransferase
MIGKPDNRTLLQSTPYTVIDPDQPAILRPGNRIAKRTFDFVLALLGLIFLGWLMLLAALLATIDTRQNGFFTQTRVGQDGRLFRTIKIRTMRNVVGVTTTVTSAGDPRITRLGRFFRRTKLDELPQLINVLLGQMSFVGPRPDVPGFADQLSGSDRVVLAIRPGITGPATLAFRHEEQILAAQVDPERYNREVIYPEKVRLNRAYIETYTLRKDLDYILQTVAGS